MKPILRTSDVALIAIAKSLLEANEIPFVAQGEGLQDLFAGGRIGGVNPITGPVEILVPDDRAEDARVLLKELIENDGKTDEE